MIVIKFVVYDDFFDLFVKISVIEFIVKYDVKFGDVVKEFVFVVFVV